MDDAARSLKPWITFAGCVLVVAVLRWAQVIIVPFALAILLTFVLTPPVVALERRTGRVAAMIIVLSLVFSAIGLAGWGVTRQMAGLVGELPAYRQNIRAKVADIRGAGKDGAVEKLQETIKSIQTDLTKTEPVKPAATPAVVIVSGTPTDEPGVSWLGPIIGPVGTAAFVLIIVVFMLIERRNLRDRLIGLFGLGRVAVTTKAIDEAASRVSRQLLMQSLVNAMFGIAAGVGLYFIGVPYPLLWASLGAVLRFIPYIGPVLGAGAPIVVSLAALKDWDGPLKVLALYGGLELFTNLVLETWLFADAAGVSQVALLLALAFWTWLWGPLGLLMATPLTVCLVVLGKHVPGLEFVQILMSDTPPLAPDHGYYQRLLARDHFEAADLIDRHIKSGGARSVYDELLLPALNYAERDRLNERLSAAEEMVVFDATRELLSDAAEAVRRLEPAPTIDMAARPPATPVGTLAILGYPVQGVANELALTMLAHVLDPLPVTVELIGTRMLASDLVAQVRERGISVVCIADLPPSPASRTRYVVKRLRAGCPELKILVGRWGPSGMADDSVQALRDAGADHVAVTLAETRDFISKL